jgi:mono/diheme cytochrome c family protein
VYTDAQAGRGQTLYGRHCEQCHGTGLEGDAPTEIPALAGDTFLQRWSGRNLEDLILRMERSMPQGAPGSLSRSEYADLAAYLLRANAFPAGYEALGIDADRLRPIVLERRAP